MMIDIDPIVALLYDGVTSSGDWYDALDAVRDAVGGAVFHSYRVHADAGWVSDSIASYESPAGKVREYEEHHAAHDVRAPVLLSQPVGAVFVDHEHFGAREMSRSPIYADWLNGIGLRHSLGMRLQFAAGQHELLGIMRERQDPVFSEQSKQLCERLSGHLVRASLLRSRLADLARDATWGLGALDRLPHAIMLVDGQARVLHANPAAQARMGTDGPFRLRQGALWLARPDEQSAFARLLAAALQPEGATAGWMRLNQGQVVRALAVLPLKPAHVLMSTLPSPKPHALLVLSTPGDGLPMAPSQLSALLGVSPTEARLAQSLAAGRTLADFARVQGCSDHTARTHLRNLLRKCGCRRQVDLVRLVQSLRLG